MMIQLLTANLFFFFWSNFLNYLGTVFLYSENPFNCFSCNKKISLLTFIPFGSYFCSCGQKFLYKPIALTLLGAAMFNSVYFFQDSYFTVTFLFYSCLLINIRTDAETFLLSRFTTIYPVPFFLAASLFNLLPIPFMESLTGICLGYGFLWIVRWVFFCITKKEGLGIGDLELLALIGAFLGPLGAWFCILAGSILGILFVVIQRITTRTTIQQIPFGPFLSMSGFIYIVFQKSIIRLLLFFC